MFEGPNQFDREVFIGIALTFGLHLAAVAVLVVIAVIGNNEETLFAALFFLLLIGVSQLIYMIPAILITYRRGRRQVAKGLILGAAITFLLCGACWAAVGGVGFLPFGRLF
jgi:hypothetical protein